MVKVTAPTVVKVTAPTVVKVTAIKVVKVTAPTVVKVTAPSVVKVTAPTVVKVTAIKVVKAERSLGYTLPDGGTMNSQETTTTSAPLSTNHNNLCPSVNKPPEPLLVC